MSVEIQFKKHVRVICDLKPGDLVTTDFKHDKRSKPSKILDVKHKIHCGSGFMVLVEGIDDYIDSDWLDKVE